MEDSMKSSSLLLVGLAAALGLAAPAQAQTIMSGTGASAGNLFVNQVPLFLCEIEGAGSPPAPRPQHFLNADVVSPFTSNTIGAKKMGLWKCRVGGNNVVIRYRSTGSSDGVTKLNAALGTTANEAEHMDVSVNAGQCTTNTLPNPSGGVYDENSLCAITSGQVVIDDTHIGASDVGGSTFGQVGPGPVPFPPPGDPGFSVSPLDDSGLNSVQAAVVPFSIYLGKNVGQLDSSGNVQRVTSLPSTTLESILNGSGAKQWQQIGFDTGTIGGAPDAGLTNIDMCHRRAGSGTKASLDATIMKDSAENPTGVNVLDVATDLTSASNDYFLRSTGDVQKCLESATQGHPNGIAYMDADRVTQLVGFPATTESYVVAVDGILVRDEAAGVATGAAVGSAEYEAAAKQGLRCGSYRYWVGERINTRTTSTGDATLDSLISSFVSTASTPAVISALPAGKFWEPPSVMSVFKNKDAGPHTFKSGAQTQCKPADNPNFPN